jgi:hypothetical protein
LELDATEIEQTDDADDVDPPLGPPFAIAYGVQLLDASPGVPGCFATVQCDCGHAFKCNLLNPNAKQCPKCHVNYSHALLFAPIDDSEVVTDFLDTVHAEPADPESDQLDGADDDDQNDQHDDDDQQDDDAPEDDEEIAQQRYREANSDD